VVTLRPLLETDIPEAERLLDNTIAGRWQARLGELVDVLDLPGVVACEAGSIIGIATWTTEDPAELACLAVALDHRQQGIGGALVEAVVSAVTTDSIWLLTTNDNLDALRLYQRHGFRIERVVVGGVEEARHLKPGIPITGDDGIPILDELILRRRLAEPLEWTGV
jgi:ribosomal protein S18 acetylase RimI-like enzyme